MLIKTLDGYIYNCDQMESLRKWGTWESSECQIIGYYPGDEDCVTLFDSRHNPKSQEERDYLFDMIWEEWARGSATFDMTWWLKEREKYEAIKDKEFPEYERLMVKDYMKTRAVCCADLKTDMERSWRFYRKCGVTIEDFEDDVQDLKTKIRKDYDNFDIRGDVDGNISG